MTEDHSITMHPDARGLGEVFGRHRHLLRMSIRGAHRERRLSHLHAMQISLPPQFSPPWQSARMCRRRDAHAIIPAATAGIGRERDKARERATARYYAVIGLTWRHDKFAFSIGRRRFAPKWASSSYCSRCSEISRYERAGNVENATLSRERIYARVYSGITGGTNKARCHGG